MKPELYIHDNGTYLEVHRTQKELNDEERTNLKLLIENLLKDFNV